MERSDTIVLSLVTLSVVLVFITGAWHFWIEKEYPFVVEAACDPAAETCFSRDCSVEGDCPPNGLDTYKVYSVNARDFDRCSDNSCERECKLGSIECTPIVCGELEEDECAEAPEPPQEVLPDTEEEADTQ